MDIKVQIADNVYNALIASGNRIQGSIGLVSPQEGNFNAHHRSSMNDQHACIMKLAHGRASVTREQTRLTLTIDHEEEARPYDVIDRESQQASHFVYDVFDPMIGY